MALKKKGIQRYQKIGGFVNLRQLHHWGMLDDRWKPLAIGKSAECDLESEAWRPDPIEMHPVQPRCCSDWWFLEKQKRAAGKSRHQWCDLGFCVETSTALLRCIAALHQHLHQLKPRIWVKNSFWCHFTSLSKTKTYCTYHIICTNLKLNVLNESMEDRSC